MTETKPKSKAATIIALVRIGMLPLILFFYLSGGLFDVWFFYKFGKLIALILFIDVAIAEWVAGFLAKRRNQTFSDAGRMFTRIANKLLVLVGLVLVATDFKVITDNFYLTGLYFMPMPIAFAAFALVCALGRDLVINSLRFLAVQKGAKPTADKFGRATIIMQYIAISVLMFYAFTVAHHFFGLDNIDIAVQIYEFAAFFVFAIATALTIISAGVYLHQNRELFMTSKPKKDWGDDKKGETK